MSIHGYQANLFSSTADSETIVLQGRGLDAEYRPDFLPATQTQVWFEQLLEQTSWTQDTITVYGKQHLTPRLSCWMGESWMNYSYSGHTMRPLPWQALPLEIKNHIESATGLEFNSVLINYYRDGKDSNSWHSDDEPELGVNPDIASLSLGAARDFHLRQKSDHSNKHALSLLPGSLLLMRGQTQRCWQHQVPKRANAGPRINLTFRRIVQSSAA